MLLLMDETQMLFAHREKIHDFWRGLNILQQGQPAGQIRGLRVILAGLGESRPLALTVPCQACMATVLCSPSVISHWLLNLTTPRPTGGLPEAAPSSTALGWGRDCTIRLDHNDRVGVGLQLPWPEYQELVRSFRALKWTDALASDDLNKAVYRVTAGQVCHHAGTGYIGMSSALLAQGAHCILTRTCAGMSSISSGVPPSEAQALLHVVLRLGPLP